MSRLLSLASGVLPEFGPLETVEAAVAADWPGVGLMIDPGTWTDSIAREIRQRLADSRLVILDVEVLWLKPDQALDAHLRILDAGAAIGARNALVVSSDTADATAGKLARLADHAEPSGMRVSLEFAAFTAVRTLAAAMAIIEAAERPHLGLLIDPLHLARTGGGPGDLAGVDPSRFAYSQFCDAPADAAMGAGVSALIGEALDGRLDIGRGGLPLGELLAALPDETPLSIELRSAALRAAFPDPVDRARSLLAATRAGLERL